MIPPHKCTTLCDPDEGIHCIPDVWSEGKTLEDFQKIAIKIDAPVEYLKVLRESDVDNKFGGINVWGKPIKRDDNNNCGYLVWIREKNKAENRNEYT